MALIILSMIFIYLCYKWGDWKNWRLYYPTMLFYIIGVLIEHTITNKNKLWVIQGSFWNDFLADNFIAYFIFPFIIIIFLSNYPPKIIIQTLYIFMFVFSLSSIEYIAYVRKGISYHNGWTFGWSMLLYFGMFPLFRLHYKKPIMTWFIFFALVVGGMLYFKIPLSDLK